MTEPIVIPAIDLGACIYSYIALTIIVTKGTGCTHHY